MPLRLGLLVIAFIGVAGGTASAQHLTKVKFPNCDSMQYMLRVAGDTLIVNCDTVLALNGPMYRSVLGDLFKKNLSVDILLQRLALRDAIERSKDSIISHQEQLITIQDTSYKRLERSCAESVTLVSLSTKKTDDALALVSRLKIRGYITSAALGAAGGGAAGGAVGAIIGAPLGFLVSFAVTKLLD